MHVASVKQTTEPTTATFKHKDFNTLMCCGAMLSKKESVLRIRKSKKNNVSKEHLVSLVFTSRFTTHSARDVFVIKLARHGLSSRSNSTCSLTGSRTRLWSRVTRGSSPLCLLRSLVLRTTVWLERPLEPLIQGRSKVIHCQIRLFKFLA